MVEEKKEVSLFELFDRDLIRRVCEYMDVSSLCRTDTATAGKGSVREAWLLAIKGIASPAMSKYQKHSNVDGFVALRWCAKKYIMLRQIRLWKIVDCLGEIAKIHNATPAQVALAWLLTRPAISSLVVGGRNEAQFTENFGAITLTLSDEDLQRLNDVSRIPLLYPYWHQHNFARPRFSDADA